MPTTDEMNAMALAQNLADLRSQLEFRFAALENKVQTLENLLSEQNRVLGEALQMAYGRGSTVKE